MTSKAESQPGNVRRALILAAGVGSRLMPETADRPKCLVDLGGRSILRRLLEALLEVGVSEWVIITGYLEERLRNDVEEWGLHTQPITWCTNPDYTSTNTLYSVHLGAATLLQQEFLLIDGDLWIEASELRKLVGDEAHSTMLVDTLSPLDEEAMKVQLDAHGQICAIAKTLDIAPSVGEAIGAYRFDKTRGTRFLQRVEKLSQTDAGRRSYYEAALQELMDEENWRADLVEVDPNAWTEIDDLRDLERARNALRASSH